jgi:hypothetical protein
VHPAEAGPRLPSARATGARARRLGDRSWPRARFSGILVAGLLTVLVPPGVAWGQRASFTGYGLDVVVGSAEGPFTASQIQNAARLRLMAHAGTGPFSLDLAYEHALSVSSAAPGAGIGGLLGTGGRGDWLPLQGTLDSTEHAVWHHRLDRAALEVRSDRIAASVGRQTISWATTLLLTPADPFAPFDPADPFRDYRRGVDAARLRLFVGAMGEVDGAVRMAEYGGDTTVTALGRARATVGRTDLAAWGGILHDDAAVAGALTTIVLDAALRVEATLRPEEADPVLRVAVGADRSFPVAGRTLYVIVEYQYDGFGARSADDLLAVAASPAYQRGELQVLGRHEAAAHVSYQLHPLVQVAFLGLVSASDGSTLFTPSVAWDAARALTVQGGLYAGFGAKRTDGALPGSEYGIVPLTGYVSGAVYF